jgi:hypothetical protein
MLNWKGEQVRDKTLRAVAAAMDSVMADCVTGAKAAVPRRTTVLQGGIRMQPTQQQPGKLVGRWGVFNILYAAAVELGTRAHIIRPKNKKALYWPGASHPVPLVHHPGSKAKPYLRPQVDRFYPSLAKRIRDRMK